MKQTLLINGRKFSFEQETISYNNNLAITEDEAKKIVQTTKKLFDEIGLNFYLAYGTLLGAVRDKGLIKGDEDVDVFIIDEEKLYNNIPFLYENGLKIVRYQRGGMCSFRINEKCYIDVYVLRSFRFSIWSLYCYSLHYKATPKKYLRNFETIDFLGIQCECPANPEKILEFWYGKNWRVPESGHKYFYEVATHYYWSHYIRSFVRKCGHFVLKWKK